MPRFLLTGLDEGITGVSPLRSQPKRTSCSRKAGCSPAADKQVKIKHRLYWVSSIRLPVLDTQESTTTSIPTKPDFLFATTAPLCPITSGDNTAFLGAVGKGCEDKNDAAALLYFFSRGL